MSNTKRAIERLTNEHNGKKPTGKKESAVADFVAETLLDFCAKSDEFSAIIAEAPAEKTLLECIAFTVNAAGTSISDAEVARRAVQFYAPDADIRYNMEIVINPSASDTVQEEAKPAQIINIFDIL